LHEGFDATKALSMVELSEFSRLVSAIHAAAITPPRWIEAMEAIRRTFGSVTSGLISADENSRVINSAYLPPDAKQAYVDYYRTVDYVLDAVEHSPVGLIHTGGSLIALNARSEFNADWMRPHRMDDGLFVRLTGGPLPTSFLVAASKESEPFATTDRLQLFTALIPHLQQALSVQRHLEDLADEARDVAEAVDYIHHGVFVVGPASMLIYLNRAAEEIVAVGDGLFVQSGRLGIRFPAVDASLHRDIANALGVEDRARWGSSLLCPRVGGTRPYVIHVVPFRSTTPDARDARALVIVIDPTRRAEPKGIVMQRLYGLTRAETEIALRVMRGDGLKPISDEMSLSTATVKTHLQHVFCKTGTHRQAELVRLLLSIAP
jgi:DNA-binding CsgD family transcriptional regulator/PAS domain-containing protein